MRKMLLFGATLLACALSTASSARDQRSQASCTTSSASATEPVMR